MRSLRGVAVISLCLTSLVMPARGQETGRPASPQPDAGSLEAGLAVEYYYNARTRHVSDVVYRVQGGPGEPGDPLPKLDYRTGEENVLTSRERNFVMAHIEGLIHLEEPGVYTFSVLSNDGVSISVGGTRILLDPDVHFDRWAEPVKFKVDRPGWFPIEVFYFERKSTSTLRLVWRTPGMPADADLVVVPPEAFAHLPAS